MSQHVKTTWTIKWNGARVSSALKQGAEAAINETMANCVSTARSLVAVDTGRLQADIRVVKPAVIRGWYIEGSWGAPTVPYAIWQEIGTSKMAAHPYIRPAASIEYPKLVSRLGRRLRFV